MTQPVRSMSVRSKLIALLVCLAAFAVITAAATIYGVQWQVQGALRQFEHAMGQVHQMDRLQMALRAQSIRLHELLADREGAAEAYRSASEEFFTKLPQVVRFASDADEVASWEAVQQLAGQLEDASGQFLRMLEEGRHDEARVFLSTRLDGQLFPDMAAALLEMETLVEAVRNRSTQTVGASSTQVLFLAGLIALFAAALVVVEAAFIRRWLMGPVEDLQRAVQSFRSGDYAHRVQPRSSDELGVLARALNEMAESVAEAQAGLRASEKKYRSLFRNLRDAVVVCDAGLVIIEYHDSKSALLGVEGAEQEGRRLLDVWPEWRAAAPDWQAVVAEAIETGKRYGASDVVLSRGGQAQEDVHADFLVYRVEYGEARYAAIVVRDVTTHHRLQRKLMQAETMEAVGTLAGGLAHDFNNMLTSVTGALVWLESTVTDEEQAARIARALRASRRAAGLSRRLLSFATSAHGVPQTFRMSAMVDTIVGSLEESFLGEVTLETSLDCDVHVCVDRDHFTQIVLNLLRNACDAMPGGGLLAVSVSSLMTANPAEDTEQRLYAQLEVRDTGCGMSEEVKRRVFEPLFTNKPRTSHHGRGLGMAVVYSAVKNAGGFIHVESTPDVGTSISICLPATDGTVGVEAE